MVAIIDTCVPLLSLNLTMNVTLTATRSEVVSGTSVPRSHPPLVVGPKGNKSEGRSIAKLRTKMTDLYRLGVFHKKNTKVFKENARLKAKIGKF